MKTDEHNVTEYIFLAEITDIIMCKWYILVITKGDNNVNLEIPNETGNKKQHDY